MSNIWQKDPQAVLDFDYDWTDELEVGENIVVQTASVVAPGDLVVGSVTESGGVVKVWLSGGTINTEQEVVCHIETDMGRINERTAIVQVVQR